MLSWILARLKEPSTYKGLVLVASVVGIQIDPTQVNAIAAAAIAIIGAIEVFRTEKK